MSRLLKSQNYLMNYLVFVFLLGFISLGAIGGCSSNDNAQSDTQVLTEEDFATDGTRRANLKKHTVVHFLEHPESEGHDNDTGEVGNDIVPLRYNSTAEHTYCWEDVDEGAGHYMELDDSEVNEIFRLDVNGCITVLLEAGNYVMTIYHDAQEERTHTVFIREIDDDDEQAVETKGLINRLKAVASNILKGIKNTVSRDAIAQSVVDNINILISTNSCVGCDLRGAKLFALYGNLQRADLRDANLSDAELWGANLSMANLTNAILTRAFLGGADLSMANLSGAYLFGAYMGGAVIDGADTRTNLSGATLVGAVLSLADLSMANLTGANLNSANLNSANLYQADLRNVNLTGAFLDYADLRNANLTGADLTGATWCDPFCICADQSIGTCNGCAPQQTCTGL